jgi:uncharacterized protein with PIN domain
LNTPTLKREWRVKVASFTVRLIFHGSLTFFLKADAGIERQLGEKTSVKDIVESCGVPHPEIDLILVDGQPVDFGFAASSAKSIDIYPVDWKRCTFFPENRLQTLHIDKFVADGHLGKLVRDLRLLGFDVLYDRAAQDRELVELASRDRRALLTRDRRLLMHSAVRDGYYLRSQKALEQTIEVLQRFQIYSALAPFTRCLSCNALLQPVEKADVFERLEPLTKIYYERFRRCEGCGQIYWQGSHFDKLQARMEEVRAAMATRVQRHNES